MRTQTPASLTRRLDGLVDAALVVAFLVAMLTVFADGLLPDTSTPAVARAPAESAR